MPPPPSPKMYLKNKNLFRINLSNFFMEATILFSFLVFLFSVVETASYYVDKASQKCTNLLCLPPKCC